MNFWETIFLFFAFLAVILSGFFFLKKRGDRIANIILGTYLLLFALNLVYNVLYWTKELYKTNLIHIFGLLTIIWVTYPPLIFLYTKRIVSQKKFSRIDLLHSIPVLFMFFSYSKFTFLSKRKKIEVLLNNQFTEYILLDKNVHLVTALIMIFYIILIYFSFSKNNLESNKKRWLKWVIGSFSLYVLAMITYFILTYFKLITIGHDYFIMYTIIFFIGLVSYFGFMQPEVFDGLSMDKVLPFKKYQKTGLSKSLSLELKGQLLEIMKNEKPYLNSELRLKDLADKLNLSKHHMSQIINEHFNSTFFFFINTYRIEEAKIQLKKETNLNITDVIYSSGFNNRVSFYNAFKKHTGTTPTAYKLKTS